MSQMMTKSIRVSLMSWALPGLGHFVLEKWIPGAIFLSFSVSMWWLVLMHYEEIRVWRLYHKEKSLNEERRRSEGEEPSTNPFSTDSITAEDAPKFPKIVFVFLFLDLGIRAFAARHASLQAGPDLPPPAAAFTPRHRDRDREPSAAPTNQFSLRSSEMIRVSSDSSTGSGSGSRSNEYLVRSSTESLRDEKDPMPRSTNQLP